MTNVVTHAAYTTTVAGLKVVHPAVVAAEPRYIPATQPDVRQHRGSSRPTHLLRE